MKSPRRRVARTALAGTQPVDRAAQVAHRDARLGLGAQRAQRLAELAPRAGRAATRRATSRGLRGDPASAALRRCAAARRRRRRRRAGQREPGATAAAPGALRVGRRSGFSARRARRRVAAREQRLRLQQRHRARGARARAARRVGEHAPARARSTRRRAPAVAQQRRGERAGVGVGQRVARWCGRAAVASSACQRRSASTRVSISTRARACASACSSTRRRAAPRGAGRCPCARAPRRCARWSAGGCAGRGSRRCRSGARRWSSFSNIAAMPPGAKPAPVSTPKPMRSASRSMSREKLSWPWIDRRLAAGDHRVAPRRRCRARLAASTPRIIAARPISDCRLLLAMLRAMWRCVTCDSSCASTEASSSRVRGHRDQARGARRRSRPAARRR